eukprot:gene3755-4695_t
MALEYEEVVVEYEEPEPDFAPPVITLTGDAMVEVEQFSTYTDSGAVANDLVDGAVRCWRVDDLGTELDTSEVTPAGAPHVLVYRAEDASGNGAEEQRQVAVVSPCVDPSYLCDRDSTEDPILCATCSASGDGQAEEWTCLCLASFETGNNVEVEEFVPVADVTPPVLTLLGDGGDINRTRAAAQSIDIPEEEVAVNELPAVHLTGPATIQVDQGAGYGACFEGAALSTICDRGATATDVEDGNLDSMVTACSTDGVDYKFEKKGLTGCSHIDTNIP